MRIGQGKDNLSLEERVAIGPCSRSIPPWTFPFTNLVRSVRQGPCKGLFTGTHGNERKGLRDISAVGGWLVPFRTLECPGSWRQDISHRTKDDYRVRQNGTFLKSNLRWDRSEWDWRIGLRFVVPRIYWTAQCKGCMQLVVCRKMVSASIVHPLTSNPTEFLISWIPLRARPPVQKVWCSSLPFINGCCYYQTALITTTTTTII